MNQYKPDYAIPPGETIKDILCDVFGIGEGKLEKLLNGDIRITKRIAKNIVNLFGGVGEQFWINADKNYIKTKKKLNKIK